MALYDNAGILCSPYFSAFIDDVQVHSLDIIVLPFLTQPHLSMDQWNRLFHRIWLAMGSTTLCYANSGFYRSRDKSKVIDKYTKFQMQCNLRNQRLHDLLQKHWLEGENAGYFFFPSLMKTRVVPPPTKKHLKDIKSAVHEFLSCNLDHVVTNKTASK
jgi:hypothetical protein